MAEYKLLASPLRRLPAHHPPRLPRSQSDGVSRLRSPRFLGRRNQLAQDLGRDLRPALPELTHCCGKRASKRRWHGEAREPLLQGLHSPAMRPFGWRRIEEQILGHPKGEPERKDSALLGATSGLGKQ